MYDVKNLDWIEILQKLQNFATCELSKLKLSELSPLKNPQAAEASFYHIESAGFIIQSGLRPHMESLDLFETWMTRLRKNAVLKTLELRDIRHFCLETLAYKEALSHQNTAWSVDMIESLFNAEEPLSAIDNLITPQCDIRMDASEKLYKLSKEKDQLALQIKNQMDRLVKAQQMDHMLQEKYVTTRDGRWVIPVKGGMQHYVPGVIHASSQTKQTVFIEPEVVIPMNNRLRQIEVEIEEEIERLLIEISEYLATLKNNFDKTFQTLFAADQILAKAQLSLLLEAEPCQFYENEIFLRELFHPLLKLNGKKPISNSIQLTPEKAILLLSGPNAGGKTVLLKSIGLAAQMARCGLPICAEKNSKIPFFINIVTGIGDSQSVDEDLSTFAAHLKTLDSALKLTGHQNLILIDEICGSTDPEEGSALARSFIEHYAKNSVFGIITSHLSPLKTGWAADSVVLNGSLEYDSKTGRPTYQYLHGIPGDSLALLTAKRVGVQASILDRATDHLSPLAKQKLSSLEEIENLKKDLHSLQNKLKQEVFQTEKLKKKLDQELKDFEIIKEKELQKTLHKATKKVEDAIATTKAADTLERHRKLQEIKYNMPEIVKASPTQNKSGSLTVQSALEFADKFPPGTKVFVPQLNQDGIIQSKPNAKGEVLVLSQSIRLQLAWQELKPALKMSNPTQNLASRQAQGRVTFLNEDRIIDVRGKKVEEALAELEIALDHASLQKEDRIKIIHGHGTEALKKALRTYLSRSVYVKKWKAGTSETGGDGVTWVEILL